MENSAQDKENSSPSLIDKKSKVKGILREVLIFGAIAFGIVLPFRIYIAEPYLVDGRSMSPTFETSDYLIVDKLSYRIGTPKRNTVVIFKYPNSPSKSFIKRIIGLPGETVVIKDNIVTIINSENPEGFVLDQNYIVHQMPSEARAVLAEDEYFVMGDNRAESFDSRSWGPLNKKFILGRPILRLLPISKIEVSPGAITEK
jgi:signal peptidase I